MILKYEKKKPDSAFLFCFVVRKYMSDNILDIFLQIEEWMDQFSSVAQSYPTLCGPMNHSTSGQPVHHQLPEFTQSHVH